MKPHPHLWDNDYEPTEEELEEVVKIDATPEELARAIRDFKPPSATG